MEEGGMDDMKGFLRELARAAAAQTLPRFRQAAYVTNKLELGFDPVTEADREAERAIRSLIQARFPKHGVIGEEFGVTNPDSDEIWVIDPIDGTRAFISGLPLWGTLVGLTVEGRAVAGMMSQPFTGETFLADSTGATYDGPGGPLRLRTRGTTQLADATLCTTTPALFTGAKRAAYDRLESKVRLARYGTDCYAYCMLAAGHIDLVVETGLQPYDIVALVPIIEQAGGVVTTSDGSPPENGGEIVAAASAELHEAALEVLKSA
jgi:histidinol phosphatase-like enzyme (inositol monophosphatase family)